MKKTLIPLVILGLTACQAPDTQVSQTFDTNAATIAQVFAEFESESDAFFTHFADDAIWLGTGLNDQDTITRAQVTEKYKKAWATYDYELLPPTNFLPGVNAQTKQTDGSVRGYFEWNISKPATDSTAAKSVRVKIYESFDFNPAGEIAYTQVYGNLMAGYAYLDSSDE